MNQTLTRLNRSDVPRLYAIADAGTYGAREVPSVVERMVANGVAWVQLRMKHSELDEVLEVARRCLTLTEVAGARLWINDWLEVARELPVAGIHLGQSDASPGEVRRAVGRADLWIGRSTHNAEQAVLAEADSDVDLVAIGPVFATSSKRSPEPLVGVAGVRAARGLVSKPLVAIGGIRAANASLLFEAGVDSVAVIRALSRPDLEGGLGTFDEYLMGS